MKVKGNLDFEQSLYHALAKNGWEQLDVGCSRRINYNNTLLLYKRSRDLCDVLPESIKNDKHCYDISDMSYISEKSDSETANYSSIKVTDFLKKTEFTEEITDDNHAGSFPTMGMPNVDYDPNPTVGAELRLSRFDDFGSLCALRSNEDSLVIGYDSEWYGDDVRKMLSWQFALIHGRKLLEYVFVKRDFAHAPASENLWLELALARILDDLKSPTYRRILVSETAQYQYISGIDATTGAYIEKVTDSWEKARNEGRYAYVNGLPTSILVSSIEDDISAFNFSDREWSAYKRLLRNCSSADIHITLVSHAAKADITTLNQRGAYRKEILRYLTEAGGGLFTMRPIYMHVNSVFPNSAWNYYYPIVLHIRDSLCSAPAGESSLDALGKVVGVPKIELSDNQISHMDSVLMDTPVLYMNYASRDAVITMLYTSAVYGINKRQAVTILSAGTKVLKKSMAAYLGVTDSKEYDRVYRGLHIVKRGKERSPNKAGFIENSLLDPLNRNARILQNDASQAFQGGYNSCSDVGYYNVETYDFDLQNAYPSAMCLVPDVDWDNCILQRFEENHVLTEQDFVDSDGIINPFPLIFAYVRYEFPHGVKYPCLPNNNDGCLVFTRTTEGIDGVYACGPELYLAVKLGAKVTVLGGYKVRPRYCENDQVSYSMRHAVKQLVADRRVAKVECGKKSIEEQILKLIVNGGYGKVAQNVKQKNHWSAYKKKMEDIGCSSITNPVSAAMITSIVRAVLLAAQNQITNMGYTVYSVTTDGFISDIPEELLKGLDLYGLRDKLAEARLFLTDGADPEIWEIKHIQNDLLNLTTRGNVSLNTGMQSKELPGVCAHNSTKSGYLSDSYDDRLWLTTQSLMRTGPVEYTVNEWTTFRKLCEGDPFAVKSSIRHVRMDFDMKRKPVQCSIVTVYPEINGEQYEIANLTTEPFETQEEFLKYRAVAKLVPCLRTAGEWKSFFDKLAYHGTGARPQNYEFSKLFSVVKGYREERFKIPFLKYPDLTVEDKCELINHFNKSGKVFTKSDWKNAGRSDRKLRLPDEQLQPLIEEMQKVPYEIIAQLRNKKGTWYVPNWIENTLENIIHFFKRIWIRKDNS